MRIPGYKLASIPRYDDIVRTAGWAESARVAGTRRPASGGRREAPPPEKKPCAAYGKRARSAHRRPAAEVGGAFSTLLRQSGMRASTGGVLATNKRTQNVSEYMLVLALCVVIIAFTLFTHWCISLFGCTTTRAFNKLTYLLTYLRYLNIVEGRAGLVMPSTT